MAKSETQVSGTGKVDREGVWGRIHADHAEIDPKTSTSGSDYDVTTWKFQAGVDKMFSESEAGSLIGGLSVFYGTASSSPPVGRGSH